MPPIASAASEGSQGSYVIADGRTLPEAAFWMGPPLVLETLAAVVANLVLRVPESHPALAFTVSPTRSGAARMLRYSF